MFRAKTNAALSLKKIEIMYSTFQVLVFHEEPNVAKTPVKGYAIDYKK